MSINVQSFIDQTKYRKLGTGDDIVQGYIFNNEFR